MRAVLHALRRDEHEITLGVQYAANRADAVLGRFAVHGRPRLEVGNERGEIFVLQELEFDGRHEEQGGPVGLDAVPNSALPVEIGQLAADASLATRQVGGVQARHRRHVDELATAEVRAVAVDALAQRHRDVLTADERERVGGDDDRVTGDVVFPVDAALRVDVQRTAGDDEQDHDNADAPRGCAEELLHGGPPKGRMRRTGESMHRGQAGVHRSRRAIRRLIRLSRTTPGVDRFRVLMTTTAPHDSAPAAEPQRWSIDAAKLLYNVEGWGDGYFDISEKG